MVDREGGNLPICTVKADGIGPDELARARPGTKVGRGPNFICLSNLGRADFRKPHQKPRAWRAAWVPGMMAVVAEGNRSRVYLDPAERYGTSRANCSSRNGDRPYHFW